MKTLRMSIVAITLLVAAVSVQADEVHDLVKTTGAKARFEGHTPKWTVERTSHTFEHFGDKQVTWQFWEIKDDGKYVALIPLPGFHTGTIYLLTHDPAKASKTIDMPTERWHIDTAIGTELRTDAYIPQSAGADPNTYRWAVGTDGTLTLTRKHAGTHKFSKWAHASRHKRQPEKYDTTNTFVFKVDPVHGYMVEGTYDMKVDRNPGRVECASLATAGRYSLWPDEVSCYRSMIAPTGKKGYEGYWLNLAAIGAAGRSQTCRDGGFGAFLNDKSGWSSAITLEGGDAKIVVCNAHADLDFVTEWPKDAPVKDGYSHHVIKHRLLYLPPEVTKRVWETMDVRFADRKKVQIRIGQLEDFEDQPLPYTTRVRGLSFTGNGPEISTDKAHSGKRSMVVKGRVWPNLPQLNLQPDTKYHLEAWVLPVKYTAEQTAAAQAKARERIEKKLANAKKDLDRCEKKLAKATRQGKKDPKLENRIAALKKTLADPPKFEGLGKPVAFIQGDYYEWSPYAGEMVVKQATNAVSPNGKWQKIELTFTSPKWGPFINISFVADNCIAYMDDFKLVEVKDDE